MKTRAGNSKSQVCATTGFQVSSAKPVANRLFCCAVSVHSASAHNHSRYEYLLRAVVCSQSAHKSHALPLNFAECTMAREQNVKKSQAARTRILVLRNIKRLIPINPRTACNRKHNVARRSNENLITARTPTPCDKLLFTTSARTHTITMLLALQHLYSRTIAQGCAAISHSPSDAYLKLDTI